jgi:primosomal protein N''
MKIGDVIALSRWTKVEHAAIQQEMIALRARMVLLWETIEDVEARLTRYELTDAFKSSDIGN